MVRSYSLPVEFAEIASQVQYIQKKSNNEYSSSCPKCGGSIHPDGSWPDRFILLSNSHATGLPFAFCRKCSFKWWSGKGKGITLSPEERRAWIAEQEQKAIESRHAAEHQYQYTLHLLQMERHWLAYHENLCEETRKLWRYRGIPNEWQDRWMLGYCDSFTAWKKDGEEWVTPTLTIPILHHQEVLNIRHRMLNLFDPGDKYRPERKGLGAPPFLADPEMGYDCENWLIVEGEIKAAVSYLTLEDKDFQVAGLPGTKTWEQMVDKLANKNVWINYDPDAELQVQDFAKAVKGRVFLLPTKIDDAILAGHLDKKGLKYLMQTARSYS